MLKIGENALDIKLPKINILIFLFISFILDNYKYVFITHYIMFSIIFLLVIYRLISNRRKAGNLIKINRAVVILLMVSASIFILRTLNLHAIHIFLLDYLNVVFVIVYSIIQLRTFGRKYAEQFFRQICVLLNLLSVIDIYQIVFNRPLLENYYTDFVNKFQYFTYGTDLYRASSCFGHPIVSGMFFSLLFICNMYILKSYWKYLLQFVALLNIYSSSSRSAWIALIMVLLFYFLKHHKFISYLSHKITYKKLFSAYTSLCISIFILIYISYKLSIIVGEILTRFGNSLSQNTTDLSSLQRTGTMTLIISKMFSGDVGHLIFGHGIGSAGLFMEANRVVIPNFTTTDNMYLTFFYEMGLLSIFVYMMFILISVRRFLSSKNYWLIELSSLCFIFISVDIFFFEGFGWGTVTTMWSFLLTLILVRFKGKRQIRVSQVTVGVPLDTKG